MDFPAIPRSPIRLKEGQRVVVDIYNDPDTLEQLHWHGQMGVRRIRPDVISDPLVSSSQIRFIDRN
jgi:FtsP/CotA-like multicopper oxidase with cupredoxin domain